MKTRSSALLASSHKCTYPKVNSFTSPPYAACTVLSQRRPRERRQHEARAVNLLVVIPAQLLFFLGAPAPQRLLDVAFRVLAADHEADLAGGVGGDGGVGVLDRWEDFEAGLAQGGDQGEVEPLVFGWMWRRGQHGVWRRRNGVWGQYLHAEC